MSTAARVDEDGGGWLGMGRDCDRIAALRRSQDVADGAKPGPVDKLPKKWRGLARFMHSKPDRPA
jgi:hypothetical protein